MYTERFNAFFYIEPCIKWCTDKTLDLAPYFVLNPASLSKGWRENPMEVSLKCMTIGVFSVKTQFRKQTFIVPSEVVAVRFWLLYTEHCYAFFILKLV